MNYKGNERGSSTTLVISLISVSVLFVTALSFGIWAFIGKQDYKTNSDKKVTTAVESNTKTVQAEDAAKYAEAAKSPLKTYTGPEAYGSVQIKYPKTWSAYVISDSSRTPLDLYAHPDVVPSVTDTDSLFALRVEVLSSSYSDTVARYKSLQKSGKVTVQPYALTKNPDQAGVRITGQIRTNVDGVMIILPLRDKALEISTESNKYLKDFDNIILPNASFSP